MGSIWGNRVLTIFMILFLFVAAILAGVGENFIPPLLFGIICLVIKITISRNVKKEIIRKKMRRFEEEEELKAEVRKEENERKEKRSK